jgi:anti-sigma regulatory factor (Ser/Thr protein kinase)
VCDSASVGTDDIPAGAFDAARSLRPLDMKLTAERPSEAFEHDALFYAGERDFVARTSAFIRDAMSSAEPILVVVSAPKIDLLRSELDGAGARVRFEDMSKLGRNPAWIIPAWADFVEEHRDSGRPFRGIGEPVTPDLGVEELVEYERHEALLNLAFADGAPWWLVCPYDTTRLPSEVLDVAMRNHPRLHERGVRRTSGSYSGLEAFAEPFVDPLPNPVPPTATRSFTDVRAVRSFVRRHALALGASSRVDDLLLATSEIATNSVLYGGGGGTVRLWRDADAVVCEVVDGGHIEDPLIGRRRPDITRPSGFGLWLANQVCDLVQVRSNGGGSVIRLRVSAS